MTDIEGACIGRGGSRGLEVASIRAEDGDCIFIRCISDSGHFNILIDGGRKSTIGRLKKYISRIPPQERTIHLLILTHIDADHIEGVLEIAADKVLKPLIREVWFNDFCKCIDVVRLSTKHADRLADLIKGCGWKWNVAFDGRAAVRNGSPKVLSLGCETSIYLLGPTASALRLLAKSWPRADIENLGKGPKGTARLAGAKGVSVPDVEHLAASRHRQDPSVTNRSSIAFVLVHGQRRVLVTADSRASDLVDALSATFGAGPYHFDLAVLPHHGADKNMSPALARVVAADRWIISTSGARSHHPNPRSISRVLTRRPERHFTELVFNSRHPEADVWRDHGLQRSYNYKARVARNGQSRVKITIPP